MRTRTREPGDASQETRARRREPGHGSQDIGLKTCEPGARTLWELESGHSEETSPSMLSLSLSSVPSSSRERCSCTVCRRTSRLVLAHMRFLVGVRQLPVPVDDHRIGRWSESQSRLLSILQWMRRRRLGRSWILRPSTGRSGFGVLRADVARNPPRSRLSDDGSRAKRFKILLWGISPTSKYLGVGDDSAGTLPGKG